MRLAAPFGCSDIMQIAMSCMISRRFADAGGCSLSSIRRRYVIATTPVKKMASDLTVSNDEQGFATDHRPCLSGSDLPVPAIQTGLNNMPVGNPYVRNMMFLPNMDCLSHRYAFFRNAMGNTIIGLLEHES